MVRNELNEESHTWSSNKHEETFTPCVSMPLSLRAQYISWYIRDFRHFVVYYFVTNCLICYKQCLTHNKSLLSVTDRLVRKGIVMAMDGQEV